MAFLVGAVTLIIGRNFQFFGRDLWLCQFQARSFPQPYVVYLMFESHFFFQYNICKKKLNSKREALKILTSDLELCQRERDIYKTKIKQLVRASILKVRSKFLGITISGSINLYSCSCGTSLSQASCKLHVHVHVNMHASKSHKTKIYH